MGLQRLRGMLLFECGWDDGKQNGNGSEGDEEEIMVVMV